MNEPINVTRAALVRLLDAVLYPNPDDPGDPSPPWGPYGPIGPVISGLLRDLSWVLLNPQPLPPREIGALQELLGRFRRSRVGVLLILVIISLSVWLLRRRSREEAAPVPLEGDEEAVLLEDEEEVVPPGAPTPRDEPMPETYFPRRTHTGSQISTKGNCRKLSESTRYPESVGLAIAYEVRERINVPIIATAASASGITPQ